MDLLRAAFLLEAEIADLQHLPVWKRRDLANIARASIRAMREAAETIEQLESRQRTSVLMGTEEDDFRPPLAAATGGPARR